MDVKDSKTILVEVGFTEDEAKLYLRLGSINELLYRSRERGQIKDEDMERIRELHTRISNLQAEILMDMAEREIQNLPFKF